MENTTKQLIKKAKTLFAEIKKVSKGNPDTELFNTYKLPPIERLVQEFISYRPENVNPQLENEFYKYKLKLESEFDELERYFHAPKEKYKIKYFENISQSIKDIFFEGRTAWEDAKTWGKSNLENFNVDLIQRA